MTPWSQDRLRELAVLDHLLREASSINDGNHCLERIASVIKDAKALMDSNLFDGRRSFMQFLIQQAHGQ